MRIFKQGYNIRFQLVDMVARKALFDFQVDQGVFNELRRHIITCLNDYDHTVTIFSDTVNVIELAKALHEAGKEAVMNNWTVNPSFSGVFLNWDEISMDAQKGRISQATFLIQSFLITKRSF